MFAGRSRLSRPVGGPAAVEPVAAVLVDVGRSARRRCGFGLGDRSGRGGTRESNGDKYKPLPLARLLSEVQDCLPGS
jgi:hypothetical protein